MSKGKGKSRGAAHQSGVNKVNKQRGPITQSYPSWYVKPPLMGKKK